MDGAREKMSIKLACSNLSWRTEDNDEVLALLKEKKFDGIELAPSKLFGNFKLTKDHIAHIKRIKNIYNLPTISIQSMWFGLSHNIFRSNEDRNILLKRTKRLVLFADKIGCRNIVFGCPKNRNIPENILDQTNIYAEEIALEFFFKIGTYCKKHSTTLCLEANPTIYGTNFLNTTQECIDFANKLSISSIKTNLDLGTISYNNENLSKIETILKNISHVHISEPHLKCIEKNDNHKELFKILKKNNYDGFVSIEMNNQSYQDLIEVINYVQTISKSI